jgi:radical SAM superfamily enzyme YgiQ (UPF0313 family)
MKITLIQPRYFNIWEALGVGYVGAYLRKYYRGKLSLGFYQCYFDSDETVVSGAQDSDIVGFSCTSPTWKHGLLLAQRLKEVNPRIRTVFGGWHPSAVPEDCLASPWVDQVVIGEGERAFLRIAEGDDSRVVKGEPLPSLNDLFPDRELIRNSRTVDLCERITGERIASFQSCRVCPHACTFCAERTVTGRFHRRTNPIRERAPVDLIEEITAAQKRFSLTYFKFVDATWNTSPEKVMAFCETKRRVALMLPWEVNLHATHATREMLAAMKSAGCRQINVGCESGSQRILDGMKKGLKIEQIERVFAWAREIGLERRAFFLLGMPNETVEDIRLTEKLVERIDPEVFGVTILCAYPGTDLYDLVTMRDHDWSSTDEYTNDFWHTPHLSNRDLKYWQSYLTDRFAEKLAWHNQILREPTNPNAYTAHHG